MCDYATETVADIEARKKTARFGPDIKNAMILALIAFLVTRKVDQTIFITLVYSVISYMLA
jgi:hypothetical protein